MGLLGMVFGFGAKDVGMGNAMDSAEESLENINELMEEQNEIAKKSGMSKMMERVKQFNVASIAGDMRSLTGETGNLTNSLESMAVANQKTTRPIVASMNLTAKEAQKMESQVSSMAIGMNMGAESVMEVFKAMHEAGGPAKSALDAMGMSQRDWVKVTETTGVTMQDYTAILGDMTASWGASPEQAGAMLGNLVEIGKKAGIGALAIKNAKGQLDALDDIFEKLPPSMARNADEIQSLMESAYKLSGAFREMGETEEKATELGQQTANMFGEQAVALSRAEKGIGSYEDSDLFVWMTSMGTSFEDAKDIIQTGSRDAVKGAQMIQDAMAKGMEDGSINADTAMGKLNETLGSSASGLAFLVGNLDKGTAALARSAAITTTGTDQLKKYGQQAYRTGRTVQEEFDLAKEVMDTHIRSLSKGKAREYAREQAKAYKNLGKEIKDLGDDKVWGPLAKGFSMFKQMGTKGLLLGITEDLGGKGAVKGATKASAMLDLVVDSAKTLGDEFGPVMEILGKFGPLGMVAGGIAAWFMISDEQKDAIWKMIKPLFDWIKKQALEIWDSLASGDAIDSAFKSINKMIDTVIDWGSIGMKIIDGIDWDSISRKFVIALDKAFGGTRIGDYLFGEAAKEAKGYEKSMDLQKNRRAQMEALNRSRESKMKELEAEMDTITQKMIGGDLGEAEYQKFDLRANAISIAMDSLKELKSLAVLEELEKGGEGMMGTVGEGIKKGTPQMTQAVSDALVDSVVNQVLGHSPPATGPLSKDEGDPLTKGGENMLAMIAQGVWNAQEWFGDEFAAALGQSVDYGFSSTKTRATDLMNEFANDLDFAMMTDVSPNVRNELTTLLSMPGLAGVTTAIVSEGSKQRVILKKIEENTANIAEYTRTLTGGGAAERVLP